MPFAFTLREPGTHGAGEGCGCDLGILRGCSGCLIVSTPILTISRPSRSQNT